MDLTSIRIREHFGLVANDSHRDHFSFLISPPKSRLSVEKSDYILVDHPLMGEACQVLAVINEISSYEEIAGSTINDKKAKMLATAEILGYIDLRGENRKIEKLLVPPNPGSRVYIPLREFLQDILNRNQKGENYKSPVLLGTFGGLSAEERANNGVIKAFVDAAEFTSKNTLISAVSGAGKTFLTQKILTALPEKAAQRVIIFDSYGEYKQLPAGDFKVTSKTNPEALLKEAEKVKVARINAHGLTGDERRAVYTEFLRALLKLRAEEKISPTLVVVEEAEILKGPVLEEAAMAATKNQLALCLLTTHPSMLGGKILSNVGTQFVGRTVDAEDVVFLKNVIGKKDIVKLPVGDWIFNGVDRYMPLKVRVEK